MSLSPSTSSALQQSIRRAQRQRRLRSCHYWFIYGSCITVLFLSLHGYLLQQQTRDANISIISWGMHHHFHPGKKHSHDRFEGFLFEDGPPAIRTHHVHFANQQATHSIAIEAEDSVEQQQELYQSSANYGWIPEVYPNPLKEPERCGIAYLLEQQREERQMQNNWTGSAGDEDSSLSCLRLCDPDWVLGGIFVQELASRLYNFSTLFGEGGRSEDWAVGVGRRARQLLQKDENSPIFHSALPCSRNLKQRKVVSQADAEEEQQHNDLPAVELGIATVIKMNLPNVLREGSYYAYEDEDDMVNDAAQIFARTIHDSWWSTSCSGSKNNEENGILLFLSIRDRVCFISTGSAVSEILPWWRLDHVVTSMKPDLRERAYGQALLRAVDSLVQMLQAGPPTLQDRLHDFLARFGVVIAFATATFVFGAWGEYRDRRKRWQYAEERSKLSDVEREKASQLQREFRSRVCPICLESFNYGVCEDDENHEKRATLWEEPTDDDEDRIDGDGCDPGLKCLDTFGVPLRGADGKRIKLLRCGHIFCEACWKSWVHSSGCGNPCICPVCRQDVGKSPRKHSYRTRSTAATPTNTPVSPVMVDSEASTDSTTTAATMTPPGSTASDNEEEHEFFRTGGRTTTTSNHSSNDALNRGPLLLAGGGYYYYDRLLSRTTRRTHHERHATAPAVSTSSTNTNSSSTERTPLLAGSSS